MGGSTNEETEKERMFAFLMAFVCMLGMLVMPDAGHVQAAGGVEISGRAHVQTFGDQNGKFRIRMECRRLCWVHADWQNVSKV